MRSILPFDELNALSDRLRQQYGSVPLSKTDEEDVIDELLDLFLLAYAMGNDVTNDNLSSDYEPNLDEVMETVDAEVAGESWRERVKHWFDIGGSVEDIIRIAETESHRIANTSAIKAAKRAGAKEKTWVTMMDDRVREQHDWLEGVTIGIDDDFYASDGSHAPAPGMFGVPEQDVNCRCELMFS
jgi:hypothetical protein